jgi:hypothetical protein
MTVAEEWRSLDPSLPVLGVPVFSSLEECIENAKVESGKTVWRRTVTYGHWEAVTVSDRSGAMYRPFSGVCAVEGRTTDDGRFLDMGALAFREEPTPLSKYPSGEPVGRIDHFIRQGNLVAIHGVTTLEPGAYGVAMDLMDVVTTKESDGTLRFTYAKIMGVTVTDKPAWPDQCKIEVEA